MTSIIAWLAQVALWVKVGWPFAVGVWQILSDGRLTIEEAHMAVDTVWPRDEHDLPVVLALPVLTKLRTTR